MKKKINLNHFRRNDLKKFHTALSKRGFSIDPTMEGVKFLLKPSLCKYQAGVYVLEGTNYCFFYGATHDSFLTDFNTNKRLKKDVERLVKSRKPLRDESDVKAVENIWRLPQDWTALFYSMDIPDDFIYSQQTGTYWNNLFKAEELLGKG